MIIKLLLAIGLIMLLFAGINAIKRMPPEKRKRAIYKSVMIGLVAIILVGVMTGRMHWLGAAFAALIPLFRFGFVALYRVLPLWLNKTGGVASFKTEHLDVKVQVRQGRVTGTVIKGPMEGQALEDLSPEQLQELETYYKDRDTKSYYLVQMCRRGGQSSQNNDSNHAHPPPFSQPDREEALQILGLSGSPSREDILAAHRRLINKIHPDRGGSDFLAARVNQARDILLNKR